VLARLHADDRVAASYLAVDGTQILVGGAPGATPSDLIALYRAALADSSLDAEAAPRSQAQAAWAAREGADWVGADALWTLSWKEAETFADRILDGLVERFGDDVRGLRPLLVESCFEGVRPDDGYGPSSPRWPAGATAEARRRVIGDAAAELLGPARATELVEALANRELMGELLLPR
jgi:hypothetical protein